MGREDLWERGGESGEGGFVGEGRVGGRMWERVRGGGGGFGVEEERSIGGGRRRETQQA